MLKVLSMRAFSLPGIALAALVATSSVLSSGCYAEEEVEPPAYAYGYEPMYYDGYVVYYDDVGRPYYYAGGAVVWIPPTAPIYVSLVNHWHAYGPAYRAWYAHHGYRYRTYYHGGYHGYRR
jgi:hypothetical protein